MFDEKLCLKQKFQISKFLNFKFGSQIFIATEFQETERSILQPTWKPILLCEYSIWGIIEPKTTVQSGWAMHWPTGICL